MAVFKPLVLKEDQDIKYLMTKLYRFSEDLKFTFSNLELDDNLSKDVLDRITERDEMLRTIKFDSEGLEISFQDLKTDTKTSLTQAEDNIKLLVSKGSVVETMITRLEVYNESIRLKTGQIIINAENMTLNAAGDATFSGNITGGAININGKFIVNSSGDCYIDDTLITETLNPSNGIYAAELEVYNDDDYINTITGTCSADSLWIAETLICKQVKYASDKRLKRDIRAIESARGANLVSGLRAVSFEHQSGRKSIGYLAQENYRLREQLEEDIPVVVRNGTYLRIPYDAYGALYAAAIQHNQERIDRAQKKLEEIENVLF